MASQTEKKLPQSPFLTWPTQRRSEYFELATQLSWSDGQRWIVWWKPFKKMAGVIYQKYKPVPIDSWRSKNCAIGLLDNIAWTEMFLVNKNGFGWGGKFMRSLTGGAHFMLQSSLKRRGNELLAILRIDPSLASPIPEKQGRVKGNSLRKLGGL